MTTPKTEIKIKYGVFLNGKCQFITEDRSPNAMHGNKPEDVLNNLKELYQGTGATITEFRTVVTSSYTEIITGL